MLDERKAAILRAVVEEYIGTAQPVGSARVARAPRIEVSSATVRNDMAALEAEGYLRQPHTSAGRVPTEKGYRFFVDSLQGVPALGRPKAEQVRSFFRQAHGELEQMLHETSQLLGDLTSYAGVVVGPNPDDACLRSVQLVSLGPSTVLAVLVWSNGMVEKHTLDLSGTREGEGSVTEDRVAAASAHLAANLIGRDRCAVTEGAFPVALRHAGDPVVDSLCERTLNSLRGTGSEEPDQVFVGGTARIAAAFDAIETVRSVLGVLEQQYLVVTLLRDVLDRGLQVAIGTETGMAPLAECALVVAPFRLEGEPAGTIGVLGPARMDYPEAMAAVAVVSSRLSNRLVER